MTDPRSPPGRRQRRPTGIGEEVEHFQRLSRPATDRLDPRPRARLLAEDPEMAEAGGARQELEAAIADPPLIGQLPPPVPSARGRPDVLGVAPPRFFIEPGPPQRLRRRTDQSVLPAAFESSPVAGIEELIGLADYHKTLTRYLAIRGSRVRIAMPSASA